MLNDYVLPQSKISIKLSLPVKRKWLDLKEDNNYHKVVIAILKRGNKATFKQIRKTSPACQLTDKEVRNAIKEGKEQGLIKTEYSRRRGNSRKVYSYAPYLKISQKLSFNPLPFNLFSQVHKQIYDSFTPPVLENIIPDPRVYGPTYDALALEIIQNTLQSFQEWNHQITYVWRELALDMLQDLQRSLFPHFRDYSPQNLSNSQNLVMENTEQILASKHILIINESL